MTDGAATHATSLRSEWLRAMASPLAYYRGADPGAARALLERLGLFALVLGAFVSLTTAGRLVPSQIAGTALAWSFLPALQALSLAVARRVARSKGSFAHDLSRYLAGHGPWFLLLVALAGVCLFAPDAYAAFRWMLGSGALPAALVATLAWGAATTAGLLRSMCDGAGRAALATAAFYGTLAGLIAGWYLAVGELQPLFGLFP